MGSQRKPKSSQLAPSFIGGIGYQKLLFDDFLVLLREHKIGLVVDVREHAFSFRPAYSRLLGSTLRAEGIDYVHLQHLGTPKRIRSLHIHGQNDKEFLELYREHLKAHPEGLETLLTQFSGRRIVLLCYEADPRQCHRSVILGEMAKQLPKDIPIVDLRNGDLEKVSSSRSVNNRLIK